MPRLDHEKSLADARNKPVVALKLYAAIPLSTRGAPTVDLSETSGIDGSQSGTARDHAKPLDFRKLST
jgi:hypothetical protein